MRGHNSPTQNLMVLAHLRRKSITPLEALNLYGCFRLAARIYDLRQKGHNILTNRFHTPTGKVVGEYVLLAQAKPQKEVA
jgi:hypothetical protein